MSSRDDQILRAAKEVVVKFIEIGRISPSNFPESFKSIYEAIDSSVKQKDSVISAATEESKKKK